MTFTYIGDLSTDLDEIRFTIGDTTSGSGVKPDLSNYSDEEIAGLLTLEITVGRTIARIYENLATLYAPYIDTKMGARDEKLSQKGKMYLALAKKWRDEHGGGSGVEIQVGSIDWGLSEDEPT